ncbi:hypothetical protein BgiBS90_007995 [Biomphalaria glabrata]|nr:hypothetical protein BgiBS90_007995 [Biomphalaria glabrata]
MNALSGEAANKTRKVKAFGKTNHAKNETSRATLVQYLNANQGKRSICIGPELNFADGKMYELVKSVKSVSSLYLITGKNDRLDRVTTEKLILHSSSGEKVTIVLGTSKMWRVYGQGQFNFRVIDSRQMRLTSGFLDMTLTRQVTKWDVTYVLDLALDSKVRYGGLLGDAVWSNGDVNFLESEPLDNPSDQVCYSMSDDQKRVEKYVSSPQQFSPDLLELIDDIAENLPPEVFGNAKKP